MEIRREKHVAEKLIAAITSTYNAVKAKEQIGERRSEDFKMR